MNCRNMHECVKSERLHHKNSIVKFKKKDIYKTFSFTCKIIECILDNDN